MFFFEKKTQKTFSRLGTPFAQPFSKESKVFCFFFSKKKILSFSFLSSPRQ